MALNFNTCLTDLRIAGNAMGDEAACFFAEAIKRQGTLLTDVVSVSKLDLSDNGISTAGAEALLHALHVGPCASSPYLAYSARTNAFSFRAAQPQHFRCGTGR